MLSDESERELREAAGAIALRVFGNCVNVGSDPSEEHVDRLLADLKSRTDRFADSVCSDIRPLLASRDAAIAERDRRIAELEEIARVCIPEDQRPCPRMEIPNA